MVVKQKNITTLLVFFALIVIVSLFIYFWYQGHLSNNSPSDRMISHYEITKSDEEWKKLLTDEQYYILRQGGTERPFSHPEMLHNHKKGTYVTADCQEPVFRSEQKFDSGTGWPSFWAPINDNSVELIEDYSLGVKRIEVRGKKCGGHLGHVFDDGPQPTGKRYCINAAALLFIPDEE